jgi:hypothetical protein
MIPSPEAARLARKLAALPDPLMRERVLSEYLDVSDPKRVVTTLDEILTLGRRGTPPFNIALLTLVEVISVELLSYDLQAQLYAAAKEAGYSSLIQLFLSSKVSEEPSAPQNERVRELTLGHRKWMARSSQRDALERLFIDPEPEVLSILLGNPRLVERDLVKIAARRPTRPELQWVIFSSRKWIARYAIKRALVLNPYTPTELSIRLLGFLNARDLQFIVSSPSLPEAVRAAASQLASSHPVDREKS